MIKKYLNFINESKDDLEVLVVDLVEDINEYFGIPICYLTNDKFNDRFTNRGPSIVFALVDKIYHDSEEYSRRRLKDEYNIDEIKSKYEKFIDFVTPRIEYLISEGEISGVNILYYIEKSFGGSSDKILSWEELEDYLKGEYKEKTKMNVGMKDLRNLVLSLV
jgi:hypothetical protein